MKYAVICLIMQCVESCFYEGVFNHAVFDHAVMFVALFRHVSDCFQSCSVFIMQLCVLRGSEMCSVVEFTWFVVLYKSCSYVCCMVKNCVFNHADVCLFLKSCSCVF